MLGTVLVDIEPGLVVDSPNFLYLDLSLLSFGKLLIDKFEIIGVPISWPNNLNPSSFRLLYLGHNEIIWGGKIDLHLANVFINSSPK